MSKRLKFLKCVYILSHAAATNNVLTASNLILFNYINGSYYIIHKKLLHF